VSREARFGEHVEYALFRAVVGSALVFGPGPARRIAGSAGRFGYRALRIRRAVVDSNLRHAFPDRDDAWIHRVAAESYAHLARETLATLQYSRAGITRLQSDSDVEGLDAFDVALQAGHGAILLAGHLGNWELGVAMVSGGGFPVDAVVRRQRNPLFDRAINRSRTGFGMRIIDRTDSTREILASLRDNRIVALIADQDARHSGFFVPFFGRPASSPRGPAVLALRTGAPLILMLPLRGPDARLEVRFRRIDNDLDDQAGRAIADERSGGALQPAQVRPDARGLTARFARELEAAVRKAPEQYLWHHRRWKTRPREEPPGRTPV
jgi:Kdo2-lipid IVA lauroyltransferase/acyltransferase